MGGTTSWWWWYRIFQGYIALTWFQWTSNWGCQQQPYFRHSCVWGWLLGLTQGITSSWYHHREYFCIDWRQGGIDSCIYTPYLIIMWTGKKWITRMILLSPTRKNRLLRKPWYILIICTHYSLQSMYIGSRSLRNLYFYGGCLMLWRRNSESYLK